MQDTASQQQAVFYLLHSFWAAGQKRGGKNSSLKAAKKYKKIKKSNFLLTFLNYTPTLLR